MGPSAKTATTGRARPIPERIPRGAGGTLAIVLLSALAGCSPAAARSSPVLLLVDRSEEGVLLLDRDLSTRAQLHVRAPGYPAGSSDGATWITSHGGRRLHRRAPTGGLSSWTLGTGQRVLDLASTGRPDASVLVLGVNAEGDVRLQLWSRSGPGATLDVPPSAQRVHPAGARALLWGADGLWAIEVRESSLCVVAGAAVRTRAVGSLGDPVGGAAWWSLSEDGRALALLMPDLSVRQRVELPLPMAHGVATASCLWLAPESGVTLTRVRGDASGLCAELVLESRLPDSVVDVLPRPGTDGVLVLLTGAILEVTGEGRLQGAQGGYGSLSRGLPLPVAPP